MGRSVSIDRQMVVNGDHVCGECGECGESVLSGERVVSGELVNR